MEPPAPLQQSARVQTAMIASGEMSCVELLKTTAHWIEQVNPVVNAICTLGIERALAQAAAADARLSSGAPPRALEGLPIAIKDLAETQGLRTTYGSALFAEHVPDFSVLYVERLQAAGAIVIGKTNVPEFGAGSQTFNPLFGTTVTPYDPACTAGGSSGGAAAALAARMLAIADGSDLGGSLRNPAAFCNVVGFRPTPGRVPIFPDRDGFNPLPVCGPMARSVADLGLMLSAMAGPDVRAPLSIHEPPESFASLAPLDLKDCAIAVSEDLGMLPVVAEIRQAVADAGLQFERMGARVCSAHPSLTDAHSVFQVLRAQMFVANYGGLYRRQPQALKDTVCWNIEQGLRATPAEIGRAQQALTALRNRTLDFFSDYQLLLLPTTQVLPFAAEVEWVREINGEPQDNYLQWMASCYLISATGCPAISVPCGFSDAGLPMGLQIVGPPGSDLRVLRAALAYEQATDFASREPDWTALRAGC